MYSIDQSFFEKIDTESKAYILGFIFADGCMSRFKSGLLQLSIELKQSDQYLLERFYKEMQCDRPLYLRSRYRKNTLCSSAILNIGIKKICNDLIHLGVHPNKIYTAKYPKISQSFHRHFIRGYFDGDGHIGIDKQNRATISIIGSENFCEEIQKQFSINDIQVRIIITEFTDGQNNLFRLKCTRKSEIIKIRDFFYKDSDIYLARKYNTFKRVHYKTNK